MKILLPFFMLLATANSCDSSKRAIELKETIQEKLSGTYQINQLKKEDVLSNKITISFDDTSNKVTGFAGCNSFFGSYTLENNKVAFSNLAASKKFCSNDILKFENQFLESLRAVDTFSKRGDTIFFSAEDDIIISGTETAVASEKSSIVNYTDNTAVKYQTVSRASFDFIMVSKTQLMISEDSSLKTIDKYQMEANDWDAVNALIEAIDVESIQNLTPPSKKHQYDGAALATLAIIVGDVEYMTPAFDHGNPPEAIEALVNKVLSIKENTLKQ
ncbi:META domain-containing protein [Winogradskyella schleiferi]|uniref:META domain-containing protein n=1 Tax=Winogradskyella schleiferi TaxID=2686078 RepID=UPI0015B7E95A|nr:META domain-containing protein [Winogradskyella schleiferi]